MMRKRTLVDLLLLGLLLAFALQARRPRAARDSAPQEEPQPTPRLQDFMRRGGPEAVSTPSSVAVKPSLTPNLAEEDPAWLVLHVRTGGGISPPAGEIWIFNEDGSFRQQVENGRLALRMSPGSERFFATLSDEFGTRRSRTAVLNLSAGDTLEMTLQIPDPELRGPGVTLQAGELYAEVSAVTPGSPAELAGLQVGDAILAIDRVPVASLSAAQLETLLLGPPGQPVHLRLVITNETGGFEELEALIARESQPSLP